MAHEISHTKLDADHAPPQLVLIVGQAGSGYSTALNVLQDVGFSTVDNLPFAMINQLISLEVETEGRNIAVSLDSRTSGFRSESLTGLMTDLKGRLGDQVKLVFLSASETELARRFNATRRHHPLDDQGASDDAAKGLMAAIEKDLALMQPIAEIADINIDTTGSSPTDFRTTLLSQLGLISSQKMPVFISSFSYRRGLPEDADMVMDMRFLDNPHWQPELAALTGRDQAVQDYIKNNPAFEKFMDSFEGMLKEILPRFAKEGRPQFSIAFGCTGGKHRSVFTTEAAAEMIRKFGHDVMIRHRELA